MSKIEYPSLKHTIHMKKSVFRVLTIALAVFTLSIFSSCSKEEENPQSIFFAGFDEVSSSSLEEMKLIENTYMECINAQGVSYNTNGQIQPNGKDNFEKRITDGCKQAETILTTMDWDGYYKYVITGYSSKGEAMILYTKEYGTKQDQE